MQDFLEITRVVEDGNQSISILGKDFDQVRITTYDQEGERVISVFKDGRAMAGAKSHDDMNLTKLHFQPRSNGARLVFRLVDNALRDEGLEDARKKVTLLHLEAHRN